MVQDINATFGLVRTVVFGKCVSPRLKKTRLRKMHRCCQPFRVHRPRPLCFDYELHFHILWGLRPVRRIGYCDRYAHLAHITHNVRWKFLVFFSMFSL